jgi:PhoPQ-activated pathogenicity-related protein
VIIDPINREIDDLATLFLDFGIEDGNETSFVIRNRNPPADKDPFGDGFVSVTKEQLEVDTQQVYHAVQKAVYLATRTKARTASLLNCPNAYEVFADDEMQVYRSADVLKGYTYGNFLEHPSEPERIMELPVAKSVVRAMDTITEFTNGSISRFGVTGFSKLGTATYIAAALDDRVKVAVPIAIYLNFANSAGRGPELSPEEFEEELETATDEFHNMQNQQYSLAVFHSKAQTPEWKKLHDIIDPSAWFSRLTKPKLCIMSSSDNVLGRMILDEPALLQPFMPGLTRFLEVPNTAHFNSLVNSLPTSSAFMRGFLLGLSPPDISYTLDRTSRVIRVQQVSNHTPVEVKMWHREILLWNERQVQETYTGSGAWLAAGDEANEAGQDGGMFVELTYDWPEPGLQFKISTPVMSYMAANLFSN